jgi:hypothetical protein
MLWRRRCGGVDGFGTSGGGCPAWELKLQCSRASLTSSPEGGELHEVLFAGRSGCVCEGERWGRSVASHTKVEKRRGGGMGAQLSAWPSGGFGTVERGSVGSADTNSNPVEAGGDWVKQGRVRFKLI